MRRVNSARSKQIAALFGGLMLLALAMPGGMFAGNDRGVASARPGDIANARPLSAQVVKSSLDYVPGEILVKVKNPDALSVVAGKAIAASSDLGYMLARFQLNSAKEVIPGTYKLTSAEGSNLDVASAANALMSTGAVLYAGPNHLFYATNTPNDPEYAAQQQWGVTQIKAEQAWDITTGSSSIVIAILDTGTASDHPDLQDKIVPGYDFVNNDSDPSDDNGHGTYTAGIAAASSNNGTGVVGISWGARIMPVKVLNDRGSGSEETIAQGIRWATDHGARIINASLGGDINTPVMQDAAKYAHDKNVLLVAAAGNTPDGKPGYPAAYDTVLAVAATGRSDTYTGFSSFGSYVGVSAPGVGILSTSWSDGNLGYEYGNGTSAASPFASGVAALIWSVNPSLTADQVKYIIEDSADDVGDPGVDIHYGYGRLNALRAVRMAQQGPPPPRTPTPFAQATGTAGPTPTRAATQGPTIKLDSTTVAPGALLAITGAGFGANEIIDFSILTSDGSVKAVGNAQSDGQGGFRAEVALPAGIPAGQAALSAAGSKSGSRASVELTISAGGGNGGQSVVKGNVRGSNLSNAAVHLKPSLGVSGPELTAQPDAKGAYIFANLSSGIYALSASADGTPPVGPYTVQVDGTASDVKSVDLTLAGARPAAFDRVAPTPNTRTLIYFPPVGHTLKGPFLSFWQANGGLPIFGYPISEEFTETSATDGKPYTVQYFERNRFEYHPEFAGTPNEVLMGLLGVETSSGRTFLPGAPFQSDKDKVYFKETQHSLSGPFLKYWQSHGGLAIFGYPISEEVMENGYRVQYFERNRFEYHPEFAGTPNEVLLGLLGVEEARRNGWIATP
ncbi:MAG: S8 family serine peptidase [Chloroflexi bacterium]|nr:S8 family serine peptidase [Chloroflexota bacterium]